MPSIAIPVSLRGQLLNSTASAPPAAFSPSTLFALNEPGVWYDPSDLTTMFQDTAGTTPVTTPGQTVALALDKSKGLVLGSELVTNGDFSSGTTGWTLQPGVSVVDGVAVFDGATSFSANSVMLAPTTSINVIAGRTYRVSFTITANTTRAVGVILGGTTGLSAGTPGTYTSFITPASSGSLSILARFDNGTRTGGVDNISVKELPGFHATQATTASRPTYGIVPLGGRRNLLLATDTMATQSLTVAAVAHTLAFTGTGTVTLTGASIAGPLVGTGASNRVSLSFTPTAASLTLTVVGSVTLAQLELGSTATAYQRVGTAFDVTEAGVASLSYLSFDGVDDFLVTPTITPGIDKAQVFAGVRKLSDAAIAIVVEHSANINTNNGALSLWNGSQSSGAATYRFVSKGTTLAFAGPGNDYASPITNVLTGIGDISGDVSRLRINGSQVAETLTDQGTGNFLAYPLYIGRRAGTSLPLNGNIFSLIVRFGANLDAGTITSTETWVNGKTGAYA